MKMRQLCLFSRVKKNAVWNLLQDSKSTSYVMINVMTYDLTQSDNIKTILITLTNLLNWSLNESDFGLDQSDHISRVKTKTVITLSGFYCSYDSCKHTGTCLQLVENGDLLLKTADQCLMSCKILLTLTRNSCYDD